MNIPRFTLHIVVYALISGVFSASIISLQGPAESKPAKPLPLRVGIFADRGVGDSPSQAHRYAGDLLVTLNAIDPRCKAQLISSSDIRRGALRSLDVVVFPGGSGLWQMKSLGTAAAGRVREFVKKGGGYVGICAGAYLARTKIPGSKEKVLNMVPAVLIDNGEYWERGSGVVRVSLTQAGDELFPEIPSGGPVFIHFFNGPVLVPKKVDTLAPFETLMAFDSDLMKGDQVSSSIKGAPFMIHSRFGRGRIVLVSGHPEATPGLRWILHRMVTIAAGRVMTAYPPVLTKTGKVTKEILYTKEMRKGEQLGLDILRNFSSEEDQVVLAFIEELSSMMSRKFATCLPALLESPSGEIRSAAARAIAHYEYFPALPAVKKAVSDETDVSVKSDLESALRIIGPNVTKE